MPAALCCRDAVCSGYTPLHMASGYMHTGPMAALLEAGADPLVKDKQGGQGGAGGCAQSCRRGWGMMGPMSMCGPGLVAQKLWCACSMCNIGCLTFEANRCCQQPWFGAQHCTAWPTTTTTSAPLSPSTPGTRAVHILHPLAAVLSTPCCLYAVCVLLHAGRDVVSLVENLRKSLPPSMGVLQRIMALEQVAAELTDR